MYLSNLNERYVPEMAVFRLLITVLTHRNSARSTL